MGLGVIVLARHKGGYPHYGLLLPHVPKSALLLVPRSILALCLLKRRPVFTVCRIEDARPAIRVGGLLEIFPGHEDIPEASEELRVAGVQLRALLVDPYSAIQRAKAQEQLSETEVRLRTVRRRLKAAVPSVYSFTLSSKGLQGQRPSSARFHAVRALRGRLLVKRERLVIIFLLVCLIAFQDQFFAGAARIHKKPRRHQYPGEDNYQGSEIPSRVLLRPDTRRNRPRLFSGLSEDGLQGLRRDYKGGHLVGEVGILVQARLRPRNEGAFIFDGAWLPFPRGCHGTVADLFFGSLNRQPWDLQMIG